MTPTRRATSLRLKPADPFELVRWLARSQSDPRKAICELVQNSLDAGAANVSVRRQRIKGQLSIVVKDDGEGVLPSEEREEALRYLATHLGHSRKMGLSPAERAKHVVAGKYGVGLLGFWCVGRQMEIRTRVGGSPIMAMRMTEDVRDAQIYGLPARIDATPTFTEVVIFDVHPTAQKVTGGRRLADFLAAELRGQLLRREVAIVVHDDVARGLAQKVFPVTAKRYAGERLALPSEIEVPGHPPLHVELYLARGAAKPEVHVACAGTLVAEDLAQLESLGLAGPPWIGRELVGMVDFAGFSVPPGTRRGVVPDASAAAFVEAMERLEPLVVAELERLDAERRATLDRDVVRDLKRALRGFDRRLPRYDLPRVRDLSRAVADGRAEAPAGAILDDEPEPIAPEPKEIPLFPPGPLAGVRVASTAVNVFAGRERRVSAFAHDGDGRRLGDVAFAWSLSGHAAILLSGEASARPAVRAAPDAPIGARAELAVVATQGSRTARASAAVEVAEASDDGADLGIPEPRLLSDADGAWRSRMNGAIWEVNDAHEDYRALRSDSRARVRYLLALLAKEIVARTESADVRAQAMLEAVVEILAHAERNLHGL